MENDGSRIAYSNISAIMRDILLNNYLKHENISRLSSPEELVGLARESLNKKEFDSFMKECIKQCTKTGTMLGIDPTSYLANIFGIDQKTVKEIANDKKFTNNLIFLLVSIFLIILGFEIMTQNLMYGALSIILAGILFLLTKTKVK